jgi:RNA polymerase sigma-70 factor (ECF subfamily)
MRYGCEVNTYGLFYRENKDRLYAYLLRMTGERQLALDLMQESFARYLGRYGRHECNKSLLYTIGRNAALDAFRRQSATAIDVDLYQDADTNPEEKVIDREKFNRTMAAVAKLAPLDRELLSLVTTTDLTYQEIGRVLNISEANVKVRIHRARTKLRETLASGGA